MGLFGLTILTVTSRTKEISIRKVMGATVTQFSTQLSKDFLKLISISLIIAIPSAWLVSNKWLEN
ncbi:MAG: hypothetical protein JST21_03600 [Bacteroidetes bacterium]|nr:hypothetical protein [Bacteroidota bacterium]